MSIQSSSYGPPPHPYRQRSRQLGPIATVAIALATTVGLIAASGVLALVFNIGG